MDASIAEIGTASGVSGDLVADSFELSAANVLEVLTLRRRGGRFIEVDGNLVPLPYLLAHVPRHSHAIFNRDALNRNEGHHVGGSHPRMRTLMLIQID